MVTDPLRGVVVGVGHLGQHHARLMKSVPGVELVGVVDPDPERGQAVAGPLEVEAFTTLDQVPDDVTLASVAAPTTRHHEVAMTLMERGVHLLVEKPMAPTLAEAREMTELAEARGLVLQVGHIERFNPALAVYRELDLVPRFIEAHRLAPFNYRTLDVSVVLDLMIHDLDIVRDLAGSPVAEVSAVGSRVLGREVDIANARITFENGCVANVTASRVSFEPMRRTRVFADDAFVSMDFGTRRAFVVSKSPTFDLGTLDASSAEAIPPRSTFKEFLAQGLMDMREIDMDETNPLQDELTAFAEAVRGRGTAGVSAHDGLAAVELAERVSELIAGHRWS